MTPHVDRIAAFSDGPAGGNPAGVLIADALPADAEMQKIAADVGYSETAFAAPQGAGWRVRYFAPVGEVAFCGHATIALGAQLAQRFGDGEYALQLNDAQISVEGRRDGDRVAATLVSPPTHSRAVADDVLAQALIVFGLAPGDLSTDLPPAIANAGNDHLILELTSRARLAQMDYDLQTGAEFMQAQGFTTINLIWAETPRLFHSRNAFASGGVLEDPATGAAAAALAGYLRDLNWPHGGEIDIVQGEDMGARSLLRVQIGAARGDGVRVSGTARAID
ncbi:phenazine biosynthesis protein PhzF family [Ruegeria intermedia]|uniref:Phenazine biosynthesis protein PhzF family n=1 Tax=Ruegeria intermedia TaxID=996115 RepID=A0A1M4UXN1_9RHOB|nr:PhzF family phenazine biosynthesis protein [Ruegeria intermedia]SHE61484.1 phenazine biosynthesis protein PhzF family [Ruegeria intermedia]